MTIFAAEGNARTFDYMAGDVGIVPRNMGHFIENLSDDEPLEVLEIFRAGTLGLATTLPTDFRC